MVDPRIERRVDTSAEWSADLAAGVVGTRLSSSTMKRFLIGAADMTRARRAEVVERMAAAYMLQEPLDASAPI